jgi:hypothetical protein
MVRVADISFIPWKSRGEHHTARNLWKVANLSSIAAHASRLVARGGYTRYSRAHALGSRD